MEYADDGDLLAKIRKTKEGPGYLREDEIWRIFLQLLAGTASLHRHNVVHRDLKVIPCHKCANIFLFKDGRAKIGDLNVSKVAAQGFLTTQTGTPYYTR
jgi:serine/threonine protein kinase